MNLLDVLNLGWIVPFDFRWRDVAAELSARRNLTENRCPRSVLWLRELTKLIGAHVRYQSDGDVVSERTRDQV